MFLSFPTLTIFIGRYPNSGSKNKIFVLSRAKIETEHLFYFGMRVVMTSKIIPFYGHTAAKVQAQTGNAEYRWLSNWAPSKFTALGTTFYSSEQYMMWRKALLFGDVASSFKILEAVTLDDFETADNHPTDWSACMSKVKNLGRDVNGFYESAWVDNREEIMCDGLTLKFSQNKNMGDMLKSTGDAILVEASPFDKVWGIGVGYHEAFDPDNWKGLNLLGECLMKVRDQLKGLKG